MVRRRESWLTFWTLPENQLPLTPHYRAAPQAIAGNGRDRDTGMGNSVTNNSGAHGLAMLAMLTVIVPILGLFVALPVLGGGNKAGGKAVATYPYPPKVHGLSNRVYSTSSDPVVDGKPVNLPSAPPRVSNNGKSGFKITALPNELQVNILANLTIRDLLVCKSVCKNWHSLVTSVPALACAAYRSCHPPGYVPRVSDTINSYHGSLRQWLNSFSEQGRQAVTRLDEILATDGPHFPEQLFFAIAKVLDEAPAFDCQQIGSIPHAMQIEQICCSPDGQYLAITSSVRTVTMCNCIDGQITTLPLLGPGDYCCFSPNSQYFLATYGYNKARLWERINNQWQQKADFAIRVYSRPRFSAKSDYLGIISTNNCTAEIYKLVGGQQQPQAMAFTNPPVGHICFHPIDNNRLATCCYQTITVWQCENEQWQNPVTLDDGVPTGFIAFSPQGNRLSALEQSYGPCHWAHIWRCIDGAWQKEATLKIANRLSDIRFTPCGNYLLAYIPETITDIWRLTNGEWQKLPLPEQRLDGSYHHSPQGALLLMQTVAESSTRVWRFINEQWTQEAALGCSPREPSIGISPHGNHMLTGSQDQTVKIWGYTDGAWQEKASLPHSGRVTRIHFGPDGRYVVTVRTDNTAIIWRLNAKANSHGS